MENSFILTLFAGIVDPFTLLAIVVIGLGAILFVATRHAEVSFRGIPVHVLSAIVVAVALVGALLNIGRQVVVKQPTSQLPTNPTFTLQASFFATRTKTEATSVPFRLSSGQINVGCGESRGTQTVFTAPPGARNIAAIPSWENIRDVKRQDKAVAIQGTVVTATGQLAGRDREWTGNCLGGGHGELVVSGTYLVDQPTSPEKVLVSSFQGFVHNKTSVLVPLPEVEKLPVFFSAEVIVSGPNGVAMKKTLDLTTSAAGLVSIAGSDPTASATSANSLGVRIEGKNLVLAIP